MKKMSKEEFDQLQAIWYRKLRESGFKDIERKNQDDWLKDEVHTSTIINAYLSKPQREAYYEKACEFMHEFEFESELDKMIWECHCEGMSIRDIALKLLNKEGGRGVVFLRIRKLKGLAKL